MSALAIRTEQLSKQYAISSGRRRLARRGARAVEVSVTAVDRVDLEVSSGELYSLLGPNGAGKTTLIKMLCTMIVPTSGRASIFGVDLQHEGQIRQIIGLATGDERSFYWRLSGRHNLEFFAVLYGLGAAEAGRRSQELLEQVELLEQADRPFRTYSSGQKQRLSIARALLHHPRLLFLDEPTRSLDPTATSHLHRFIEEDLLRREGMTVFLTTHRLDEAERLSHRIGIMHLGRLRAQGRPDTLRAALGPTVRYRLTVQGLTGDANRLGHDLAGSLQVSPGHRVDEQVLALETHEAEPALAELIRRALETGGQIRDIQRERPSLDQVFQRFTQDDGQVSQ